MFACAGVPLQRRRILLHPLRLEGELEQDEEEARLKRLAYVGSLLLTRPTSRPGKKEHTTMAGSAGDSATCRT